MIGLPERPPTRPAPARTIATPATTSATIARTLEPPPPIEDSAFTSGAGLSELSGPVQSTSCAPAGPTATQFPASRVYKCFVETASSIPGEGKDVLGTGYPFVATVYIKQHSAAWCKENPHADEKGSRGDVRVKLSPVCAGNLTHVL